MDPALVQVYRKMSSAERVSAGLAATDMIRDGGGFLRCRRPDRGLTARAPASSSDSPGVEAWCSRPEELIIKKLHYYDQGASDTHLRGVASMLRISPEQIDLERVRTMAIREDLVGLWERVLDGTRDDET